MVRHALGFPLDNHFLNFGDRFAGIQALRAGPSAIQDRVTPIEPEWVFQIVEALACRLVTAVGQPSPCL
jgi:hypothetical protein